MVTLRELAAESFGRVTRSALEPQLAQLEEALGGAERPVAVAPGRDQAAAVAVVVTDHRLLLSRGAPFVRPSLAEHPLGEIVGADAAPDDDAGWQLTIELRDGRIAITGMADRDAQRIAALLV